MKQVYIFIWIVLLGSYAHAQQEPRYRMSITNMFGNYYAFTVYKNINGQPFPSNGMYVVTDSGVVMIDTPWDPSRTPELLDSIEIKHHKKVVLCIVTHYHDDRTAGLGVLRALGVKTYSSLQTKQLAKEKNEEQAEYTFTKDTTFMVGNLVIETHYPGEGHTADNIVVWFSADRVLYGGCLVKSTAIDNLGNVEDANLKAWPLTIEKLLARYPMPVCIVPGHYVWDKGYTCLKHTLDLLRK